MKKMTLFGSAVLAALLCGSMLAPAETIVNRADVPFAFVVNGKTFPAGAYYVQHDDANRSILYLRSVKGDAFTPMIALRSDNSDGRNRLVFDDIGGQQFLRSVRVESGAFLLPSGKAEKLAKKAMDRTASVVTVGQ